MKKQIGKKIIIIIVGLIFISTNFIYPLNTSAATKLNWDNPNQGKNPYKFKLSDYLNSQMAMQVIGCTGIVNKVSKYMSGMLQSKDYKMKIDMMKTSIAEGKCLAYELGLISGLGSVPNLTISNAPQTIAGYCESQKTKNPELYNQAIRQTQIDESSKFREECLNGIAYTLARNQLTSMTKQTMNWITSGFNGDPMYVRNINSFLRSVEDEIIYQELNSIKNLDGTYNTRDYPYGRDFSASYIRSRQSAQNFAESSKQDLTNYLTDGATIDDFANDFSKGGWYGWLGLTQHAQNNPLGYTYLASQNMADKQAKEAENIKVDLDQGNGVLSDKKCVVKAITKKAGQIKIEEAQAQNNLNIARDKYQSAENIWLKAETNELKNQIYNNQLAEAKKELAQAEQKMEDLQLSIKEMEEKDECAEWEVVTPGSLIQDKVSYYLNSPERQLEIADNINEVLNVLFAQLINKLRLDGLSSLNSETFNNNSGGIGSNSWTTPINYTDVSGNKYAGSGLDENRAFDLTKDLGNIYNRTDVTKLGTWDANKNETTLTDGRKGLPLVPMKGEANTYYEVTTAGNTKLFIDGYDGWAVGDRAFFDGSYWQNWKCKPNSSGKCTEQNSPIAKRGIIQIQKDYEIVAKELLKVMPAVMPALGELDYCIPGPNPNWQANSVDAYEAFTEFISGLQTVYKQEGDKGDKKEGKDRVNIVSPSEDPNNIVFKNYRNIFKYNDNGIPLNQRWYNVENSKIYRYTKVLANSTFNNQDGDWIKESQMANANDEVSELIQNIFDSLEVFDKEYPKTMNETYGVIQNEYLNYEGTRISGVLQKPNPAYIPMAKDGLTMTKKMMIYNEEILDARADLIDTLNENDSVVNKLELIKNEVGKIIKTAQDRRDKTITEALNADPYNENYGTNYTAYKTKYAVCLDEENIDYLDYDDIVIKESGDRCSDTLDNDFDGLTDMNDPDCSGLRNRNSGGGVSGGGSSEGGASVATPLNDYGREDQYLNTEQSY